MDDSTEANLKDQLDAGRGIAKADNQDSKNNTTSNQGDKDESLDERARKAGI